MRSFKLLPCAMPFIAALGLASGAVFAQAQAPANTGQPKAQKPAQPGGQSDRAMARRDQGTRQGGRDWARIDANKDNLVSPEEMEAFLKANPGPLATTK